MVKFHLTTFKVKGLPERLSIEWVRILSGFGLPENNPAPEFTYGVAGHGLGCKLHERPY